MLTGFEACVMYTALKIHFTPGTYDYFKYNGKVKNITPANYETRKDRWFFHKLAKVHPDKDECAFFIAANFFERDSLWVRDLLAEEAEEIAREKLRIKESLMYLVCEDIEMTLADSTGTLTVDALKDALKITDGDYPALLRAASQGSIHKETLVVLNAAIGFLPLWHKKLTDTILFPTFAHKCTAYQPFLGIDVKKVRETLKMKLTKA